MTDTRCECCDLPDYSCGKAKETAQRVALDVERRKLVMVGWTWARYPGVCAQCGERFGTDAVILYFGDGRWKAECCA